MWIVTLLTLFALHVAHAQYSTASCWSCPTLGPGPFPGGVQLAEAHDGGMDRDKLSCSFRFEGAAGGGSQFATCQYNMRGGGLEPYPEPFHNAVCPPSAIKSNTGCCAQCRDVEYKDISGFTSSVPDKVSPSYATFDTFQGYQYLLCRWEFTYNDNLNPGKIYEVVPYECIYKRDTLEVVEGSRGQYSRDQIPDTNPNGKSICSAVLPRQVSQGNGKCTGGDSTDTPPNKTGKRAKCEAQKLKLNPVCRVLDVVSNIGGSTCGPLFELPNLFNGIGQLIATAGVKSQKGKVQEVQKQAFFAALTAAGDLLKSGTLYATLGKKLAREAIAKGIILSVFGPEWATVCSGITLLSYASTACSLVQVYAFDCTKKPVRRSPAWLTAFGNRKRAPREPEVFSLVPRSTNQCTDFISKLNSVGFDRACPALTESVDCSLTVADLVEQGSTEDDARKIVDSCAQVKNFGTDLQFLCAFYNAVKDYELVCDDNYVDDAGTVDPGDGTKPGDGTGQTPPSGGSTTPPSGGSNPPSGSSNPPSGSSNPPSSGSNFPSGGSTPPSGGSTDPGKGNNEANPPSNVPVTGGVTWTLSKSCELVKIYGDSPDSPDSPDSQPELPELKDYPGGYYYLCKDGTVPDPSLLPGVDGKVQIPGSPPVGVPGAHSPGEKGPNGCTWTRYFGDSLDTPDTPDSPHGEPEIDGRIKPNHYP